MEPLACPGCGATRGLAIDTQYFLTNGHKRRLRICSHCGSRARTIQPPGEPERLSQECLAHPSTRLGLKLTPQQVVEIREAVARGETQCKLAKRYVVSRQVISQIVWGQIWKNAGGPIRSRHGDGPRCGDCEHFTGRCGFGFPEAESEPWFAGECDFYVVRSSSQASSLS